MNCELIVVDESTGFELTFHADSERECWRLLSVWDTTGDATYTSRRNV